VTVNGVTTATPFPNNRIPRERFDPTSVKLLEFWPRPNLPTTAVSQNFLNPQKTPIDKVQYNQRNDFIESSNSQWFGRFSWTDETTLTPSLTVARRNTADELQAVHDLQHTRLFTDQGQ
jgi:hypothetical protein